MSESNATRAQGVEDIYAYHEFLRARRISKSLTSNPIVKRNRRIKKDAGRKK